MTSMRVHSQGGLRRGAAVALEMGGEGVAEPVALASTARGT